MNIGYLKAILFRNAKSLFLISAVSVVLCLIVLSTPPFLSYVARARLLVRTDIPGEGPAGEQEALSKRAVNTQMELLKNRYILEEVIKKLQLKDLLGGSDPVARLQSMVKVKAVEGTDLIEVSVRAQRAELAAKTANALCKEFMVNSAKDRFSFGKDMASWLSEQSSKLRKELEASQNEMQKFRSSANAIDIEDEYKRTKDRISKLQYSLNAARGERQKMKAANDDIDGILASGKAIEELPQVRSDDEYKRMRTKLKNNKRSIDELLEMYQPDHPRISALKDENSKLKGLLASRADEIVDDIRLRYQSSRAREKEIEAMIGEEKTRFIKLEGELNRYNLIFDELKAKEDIYNTFLKKAKDELIGGVKIRYVTLVEGAYLPRKKEGIALPFIILIGLLLGLITTGIYNSLAGPKGRASEDVEPHPANGSKGMYIEKVREDDE